MMLATLVDWANVVVVFVVGLPGIVSAIYAARVHAQIRTPSGVTIGRQVEGVHHVALANNQRLVSVNEKLETATSAFGLDEESQVPKLVENGHGDGGEH